MTEADWEQMQNVLRAMKSGLTFNADQNADSSVRNATNHYPEF